MSFFVRRGGRGISPPQMRFFTELVLSLPKGSDATRDEHTQPLRPLREKVRMRVETGGYWFGRVRTVTTLTLPSPCQGEGDHSVAELCDSSLP